MNSSMRNLVPCAALVVLTAMVFGTTAHAMRVSPMVIDLSTTESKNGQITVLNDGASKLPVEIVVSRVEIDEKGEISAKLAEDDFVIFPPQALIPSGGTQVFRVQWVGDPQIKSTQSYTLSVNQVPVKMPEGKSGVQVVFNFGCIATVSPPHGTATIEVVKTGLESDEKGKSRPAITVKNGGNLHAKITDATIRLSSGTWSQVLAPEQLRQLLGVGLVQPGKTRRFLLPVEMPAGTTSVNITLEYKQPK